jgi:hypothetical protein
VVERGLRSEAAMCSRGKQDRDVEGVHRASDKKFLFEVEVLEGIFFHVKLIPQNMMNIAAYF